jgi:hypothetical protein
MPDINQGTGSIYMQAGFGSAAAGGAIKLHGHNATTYTGGDVEVGMSGKGNFLINSYIGGTRLVTVKVDGNVGIGTTSPVSKLHISGSGQTIMRLDSDTTTSVSQFQIKAASDAVLIMGMLGGSAASTNFGVTAAGQAYIGTTTLGTTHPTSLVIGNVSTIPIVFSTNNTERMRILSDGNVGIGTTSPSAPLAIYRASNPYMRINGGGVYSYIQLDDGTSYGYLIKNVSAGTGNGALAGSLYTYTDNNKAFQHIHSGTPLFTILSGGNVGIGTTAPSASLHVNSTTAGATLLRTDGTNGTLFSVVDDLSDSLMSVNNSAGLPVLEVFADDRIVGGQYGQNDFVVVNNKVGIGTNNPIGKLHVTGSSSVPAAVFMGNVGIGTTSPTTKLAVSDGTTIAQVNPESGVAYFGTVNNYPMALSVNSSEKVRVTSTGAFLVGNTSAPNPGAATTVSGFAINGSGNDAYISHKIDSGPCAYFRRDGTDGFVLAFYKANSSVGTISVTTTATAYNTTSDYRLKESIKPLSAGLSRINSLKPSVYTWKSDGSNGEGFMAHELAEVVPLAVTGQKDAVNDDGSINPQSVDLSKIVPILVAAIQELSAKVKTLEVKVQILESK